MNMPEKIHQALLRQARKKKLKGKRKAAYVYGTMQKIEAKMNKKT